MAGINSKAAGKLENKKQKFQGQELDDDLGLNWYGFKWRNHDPQIGRFIEIDPLSEEYEYNSTYAFSENKVTGHIELEGLEAVPTTGVWSPVTGKYLVQGDVNNDMVVDKSERESWSGAVLAWIDGGTKGYAAAATTAGLVKWAVNGLRSLFSSNNQGSKENTPSPQLQKAQERADKLSQKQRPGENMTKAGKEAVKDVNRAKNGGKMKCENCGTEVQNAAKHTKGNKPPGNEAHVDHVDPKANGGSGTPDNGQILCRDCNLEKGAIPPPNPIVKPPSNN
jgi:RHS repeat-associated protein